MKQPSLEVALPIPAPHILAAILQEPEVLQVPNAEGVVNADGSLFTEKPNKRRALILDAILALVKDAAKGQFEEAIESFGSDATKRLTPGHLDYDKLTLDYIASIEPEARGGVAISDDEWKEFGVDYINVMLAVTGKEKPKLVNAVDVYMKPTKVRTRKDLLPTFLEQLALYIGSTEKAEEFAPQVAYLKKKFEAFLKEEDKLVADAF